MALPPPVRRPMRPVSRAIVEIGSILFLFYANLLMGEFTRSTNWRSKTLAFALADIVTYKNFGIALLSAIFGYLVFEYLRKKT